MTGEVRHFGAAGLGGILAALGRFGRPRRFAEGAPVPLPSIQKLVSPPPLPRERMKMRHLILDLRREEGR